MAPHGALTLATDGRGCGRDGRALARVPDPGDAARACRRPVTGPTSSRAGLPASRLGGGGLRRGYVDLAAAAAVSRSPRGGREKACSASTS